ncbi:SARP family transcriptional regulator (plasmid) [Deinococcus sp. KNUC1210]|uniref:AAA family ATPase n=1 Tax=Deinococcus sp. KNUC1210 TaxID=2917691 RepID=UPI001EF13BCD|nr:AAA family ATPase [Deinococcus sp. KNUC1210]ULH17583.1 SARP family transcriptional regulator [Deinococcus sp. KNUC1210]
MLTIHTLGHVYITLAGKTIPVSAKALALITYLYLEKLPQHRERLADLLWNTPLSRKNLRVELARIRSAGLNIFPSSHQLLQLDEASSDFEPWCAQFNQNMNQPQLTAALATLRGIPLTGLEDLGGSTFQTWVDQQRWLMIQQVEHHLSRAYWRYARENQTWATRLISERAEALGLENPADALPETLEDAPPASTAVSEEPAVISHRIRAIHFERPVEDAALQQAFRRASEHSQLILLHGPAGSGKTYLSERVARQFGWYIVRVPSLRSCRFVLASVAQSLLACCDPQDVQALQHVLLHPASLEEDVVKVGYALSRVPKQVLLLFEQAQDAPTDLIPLMEFLFRAAGSSQRIFLISGRDCPVHVPLARALLHRIERSSSLELEVSPLSNLSVQRALEAQFPFEPKQRLRVYAARLLQRSDGNPMHLLSLLDQAPTFEAVYTLSLPQSLRDSYDSEIDACSPELQQALKRLSVIYGRFDRRVARAVLPDLSAPQVDALLGQAVSRRLLVEADPEQPVHWSQGVAELAEAHPSEFVFRTEGLRMTITSPLTASLRQEIRRRLMAAYADVLPGHAAYYARRAHLAEEALRLERIYHRRLPIDSPLLCPPELHPRLDGSVAPQSELAPDLETHVGGPPIRSSHVRPIRCTAAVMS